MSTRQICLAFCLAFASSITDPASVNADVLATDTFSYSNGETLYGQNGGTGWTTIWTGSGMVTQDGRAVGSNFGNPPLYGTRNFDNPAFGNPNLEWLFVSVEMTAPNFGIDDYFAASTGSGVNNTQIAFGKRAGSANFEIGNGGWASSNIMATANTTWHLIGAYRLRPTLADHLYLWVNPDGTDFLDPLTSENSADAAIADFVSSPAAYVNIYTNIRGAAFDNLVISNSPGGVGLASSAVPEPAVLPVFLLFTGWVAKRGARSARSKIKT